MTAAEIKTYAARCSCAACVDITAQDLYVSAKSPDGRDWREITCIYGPKPCQCGCGGLVQPKTRCLQKTGVGVRILGHRECVV